MSRLNRIVPCTDSDVLKTIANANVKQDITSVFHPGNSNITVGTTTNPQTVVKQYTNTSQSDEIVRIEEFIDTNSGTAMIVLSIIPPSLKDTCTYQQAFDRAIAIYGGNTDDSINLNWVGVLPAGYTIRMDYTSVAVVANHYFNESRSGNGVFNIESVYCIIRADVYNPVS